MQVRIPAESLSRGRGAHEVHTARWEAVGEGRPLVCVHGLGGSHANWSLTAPRLVGHAEIGEIWAPDLAGFGYTPLDSGNGPRRATLADNLDLLEGFVRTVSPDRPVLLAGNSMGGLLSLMLGARRPELVAGLVVVNPALPVPVGARLDPTVVSRFALLAVPFVGERYVRRQQVRLTPEEQVRESLDLCAADLDAVDPSLIEAHVRLATDRRGMPHAVPAFLEAARDVVRTLTIGRSGFWREVARIDAPTLYVQGAMDRLVRPEAAAQLVRHRPDWTHLRYDDLGHVPMIEDAARFAADLGSWLTGVAEPSAR